MAKATRKDSYETCKDPGDFFLTGNDGDAERRLSFLCPCGCGTLCGIKVGKDQTNGCWAWNGDCDKPTATPSINVMDGPDKSHWHGYLTNGEFKT